MADLTRSIQILFEGTNRTSSVIKSVGADLDKLNYSVSSVATPFASVTKAVAALDAALLALAAAGIAVSVKRFAEFEDTMLKVKGIMGASEDQYESLTDLTKELGATTRYTAKEAGEGLEFLAMAGLSFEDSMSALPDVLNLAQASATGLGDTADILTNIMSGYGIAADDLTRTSDVLTQTFTSSNTNLVELGNAFKFVGPVAKSLGLELEETGAILGVLANSGYKAEQGGTALRNILLALVAPASGAAKMLKEMGVSTEELGIDLASSKDALASLGVAVKDSEGNLRDFPLIMDDVRDGLLKIQDPADRTAILIEIFGKRGGPQMAALLEKGSEAVVDMESKLRSLEPVTKRIAEQMESGVGGALRSLRSAFEAVTIEAGEKFGAGLIGPIESVIDLLRTLSFEVGDGTFDPVFDAFAEFGEEIRKSMDEIVENLPAALERVDWSGLINSFGDLKETISGIFDGIDFDSPDSLAEGVQTVIDSLESLVRFSDGIAGVFIEVAREIKGLIDRFNELDEDTKKSLGSISGVGAVISGLTGPVGEITQAIKGLGTGMSLLATGQIARLVTGMIGSGGLTTALTAVGGAATTVLASPLFAAGAAAAGGVAAGSMFRALVPEVDAAAQAVLGFIDKHTGLLGVHEQQQQNEKDWQAIQARMTQIQADRADAAVKAGTDFEAMVKQVESAGQGTEWLTEQMRELGILVTADMKVNIDTKEANEKIQKLEYWREGVDNRGGEWVQIVVPVDTKQVDEAKKKIEEIPAVKRLEFETDIQIAEIQAKSEALQSYFEFKATVDVAELEASTERIKAISEGLTESFSNTGEQILGLFSAISDAGSISEKWAIQDQIAAESERRDAVLQQQKDLNQANIDYIKAKTDRLKNDDAIIKVTGDGLQPHLEAIMWELLAAIQVRAANEGIDALLLGG